ncbi:CBS domain-containing protein [Conexibacter sp. SYSU D00693]|uniref:CBS domain-containing protein n=1 Tax=Conexibacter sp. SYSU D00693 TaxID=2812560 RepID=UPI00196A8780|nr:CBS domain-containing protein [Conexibacter sp. SYSU D00693]
MPSVFVRDVMDPEPVTVTPETGVEEVWRLMKDNELPGLPVVNEGGRCVGIVTEADLVIADEEGDLHVPKYIELFGGLVFLEPLRQFERRLRKAAATTVGELMTEDPVTIEPDATVRKAARVIADRHHNRLPVVEHGRLVGLVTRIDVLRALADEGE